MSTRWLIRVFVVIVVAAPASPTFARAGNNINASAQASASGDTAHATLLVDTRNQPFGRVPTPGRAGGKRVTCRFYVWNPREGGIAVFADTAYTPGEALTYREQVTPEVGRRYVLICTDDDGNRVVDKEVVYDPATIAAEVAGGEGVTVEQVRALIRVPRPVVQTSPARDRDQTVNVETWFWIENRAEVERSLQDVGEIGGYRISVTGADVRVRIDPGDGRGAVFTCTLDEMRVWRQGGPDDTACGYRYFKKSTDQAGGVWRARASVVFETVRWTATGPDGTPVDGAPIGSIESDVESVPLRVREVQAVIR